MDFTDFTFKNVNLKNTNLRGKFFFLNNDLLDNVNLEGVLIYGNQEYEKLYIKGIESYKNLIFLKGLITLFYAIIIGHK